MQNFERSGIFPVQKDYPLFSLLGNERDVCLLFCVRVHVQRFVFGVAFQWGGLICCDEDGNILDGFCKGLVCSVMKLKH